MGLFSSLPWLFLTSIFFTVISFHFVKKIIANVRSGLFFPILFGVVNGVIATTMETMVDKNLPYVIMFFVPLAIVLEVFCVSKNPFRVYVFLLGAFLINYSGTYSLALAASGLTPRSLAESGDTLPTRKPKNLKERSAKISSLLRTSSIRWARSKRWAVSLL